MFFNLVLFFYLLRYCSIFAAKCATVSGPSCFWWPGIWTAFNWSYRGLLCYLYWKTFFSISCEHHYAPLKLEHSPQAINLNWPRCSYRPTQPAEDPDAPRYDQLYQVDYHLLYKFICSLSSYALLVSNIDQVDYHMLYKFQALIALELIRVSVGQGGSRSEHSQGFLFEQKIILLWFL